jgi:hypothetical protein
MPAKTGFQLQKADIELIHCVYQLRLATIDHLSTLSGRSVRALWARLLKLKERRYLAVVERFQQKHIYAIGREALPVLIEQGYAPDELADRRLRHHELKELGIRHALFIADIHTQLLLLTRNNRMALDHWIEGPTLWDSVTPRSGTDAIPIRPDAYFILKHAELSGDKNISHIFLEADRSTMAHSRMASKIAGYLAYHEQQVYKQKYPGMRSFIVATVTTTRERADELRRDLLPLIPRSAQSAYRFIPFEDLTPAAIMTKTAGPREG